MNQSLNTNTQLKTKKTALVFLVVLVLSSFGMLGQEIKSENDALSNPKPAVVLADDSELDFVNWFMSSKQNTLHKEAQGASKTTTKKQIITSGSQPNKVLYRTFLKRIAAQDSAIV